MPYSQIGIPLSTLQFNNETGQFGPPIPQIGEPVPPSIEQYPFIPQLGEPISPDFEFNDHSWLSQISPRPLTPPRPPSAGTASSGIPPSESSSFVSSGLAPSSAGSEAVEASQQLPGWQNAPLELESIATEVGSSAGDIGNLAELEELLPLAAAL